VRLSHRWLILCLLILPAAAQTDTAAALDRESLAQLLTVRRVYVDRLTGGETAAQMRDMIISSLQGARLFVITENEGRADAYLRGSAEDLVFTDSYTESEGVSARGSANTSRTQSTRSLGSANAGVSLNESSHATERKHEASAAVRLVNKDGDVIWSTTQESLGGKFRGASADVADRITRQLAADFERARKARFPASR
jgi:hypothetical protein